MAAHFDSTGKYHSAADITSLTDSTGGAVTSTLAAGITDAAAKNAIASLAAKINAILVALRADGTIG